MPRAIVEDNSRLALRVRAEDKATLMRAVALQHTDMTAFILGHALEAARQVIEKAERLALSERDSRRVLKALDHPPAPNARMLAAARALPPEGQRAPSPRDQDPMAGKGICRAGTSSKAKK